MDTHSTTARSDRRKPSWGRDPLMATLAPPLAVMAVLWTVIPALVHTAPPLDVVESGMWGREWVLATYKHPAMPAWLIEASRWLNGGSVGWPVYAVGQLFDLATLAFAYLLARDLAGPRVALAVVVSLMGVEYLSWRSVEFNHTQAQMPFWVATVWCTWRAVNDRPPVRWGSLLWWVALGAAAAVGLYAKLSNAMLLLVIAGWMLAASQPRALLRTPGPWVAALLFAVLVFPLGRWLVLSDFQPLAYAEGRGREQTLAGTLKFPITALLQFTPVFLTLVLAGLFRKNRARLPAEVWPANARHFLIIMAIAPPLLSVVIALAGGSGVRASWMAPSLPLLALLTIMPLANRLTDIKIARLTTIGWCLAVLVPLAYGVLTPYVGRVGNSPPLRVTWPQRAISATLADIWQRETGKPLRIIAGAAWPAGLVGLDHPDRPSILTEGRLDWSPWITPERLAHDGALVVWMEGKDAVNMTQLNRLIAGLAVRDVHIPSPRATPSQDIILKYAILPPQK